MASNMNELRALRRFGEHLRSIREGSRVTQTDAARHLSQRLRKRVTQDRISYIERGRGWPTDKELSELLALYGVDGPNAVVVQRMVVEGQTAGSSWWDDYRRYMSRALQQLVECESVATEIWSTAPVVIPGLFQTRDYTAELLREEREEVGSRATDAMLEIRQGRAKEVFGRTPAVKVRCVMSEAALHWLVGGPEVMRQQLFHTVELAQRPQVTVQVLGFSCGAPTLLEGVHTVHDYGGTRPATIHADFLDGVHISDVKTAVTRARERFRNLASRALSPSDSLRLIENIGKGY